MKIKCKKCDYEWDYSGKLFMATCPCCSVKNKTNEKKRDDKDGDIPNMHAL